MLQNKTVVFLCQYFLAALFVFSGVAKAINPFGLANQFGDYFNAMGLDFLFGSQLFFAVALPAFEIFVGLALAFGIYRKIIAWVTLLLMGGFTLLTFWIAIFNPVNDCGCFGEILKISNWATFYKNIAFLAFAIVVFKSRSWQSNKFGNFYNVTIVIFAFMVPFYFLWKLPLVDGTNFKVGNNLIELLDSDEVLVTLPVLDSNGRDVHTEFVNDSVKILFIVSPKLDYVDAQQIQGFVDKAKTEGTSVALLTAADLDNAKNITNSLGIDAFNSDYIVLKTLVQNFQGGAILIDKGVIAQKWPMSAVN